MKDVKIVIGARSISVLGSLAEEAKTKEEFIKKAAENLKNLKISDSTLASALGEAYDVAKKAEAPVPAETPMAETQKGAKVTAKPE